MLLQSKKLRANDPLIQILSENEIKDMIISAFATITPNDCYSWIDHCGYYEVIVSFCLL